MNFLRMLAVILVAGITWFVFDVFTDESPPGGGDRFARVDAYVSDQMEDSRIPGAAIAIVEGGATVHAQGFGHDGHGNSISPDTPFWIGSNTKSITALAIMQLVEAGDVDLDAPAQEYVPEFRVADEVASAQITVRHLLNQTSGISRRDGLRAAAAAKDQTLDEAVEEMRDLELNRPVGERFEYANLNSVVLGAIVERVTGQRWQEYVQANILDPLGMARTYTTKESAEANGLTATHRYAFGFPIETEGEHVEGLAPTGFLYSTANDMARYLAMYLEGGALDGDRVLSARGIETMLTAATDERTFPLQGHSFTAQYGAGWFVGPFGAAEDARWHQGALPHFSAWMVLLPETDQAVVVLINAGNQLEFAGANRAWSRIPEGVVNILRDAPPPTGYGTTRFFIAFNTIVVIVLLVQVWSLVRVTIEDRDWRGWNAATAGHAVPLLWEIVVAVPMLLFYPVLLGDLGWRATFEFIPDLTVVVASVAGLWLATGVIRIARLLTG